MYSRYETCLSIVSFINITPYIIAYFFDKVKIYDEKQRNMLYFPFSLCYNSYLKEVDKMKNTTNMTEGSILKNLIYFAIPVLIGNIFQQLYNVADTAIIGNILGDNALAAVGASAPVYGLLIGFAGGLTNGFAVIIARYFGAGNEREMKKSVALVYILSAAIAFVLTVSSIAALHPLMKALKTPDDIIMGLRAICV